MIALNGITDCSDLLSTQEEADTRIILHVLNADKLYRETKVKRSHCGKISRHERSRAFDTSFSTNDKHV